MKRIFILFLIVISANNIFGQNPKLLFEDEFTDNKNNWIIKNKEDAELKIQNGVYYIHNKHSKNDYQTWNDFIFDWNSDFSIEIKLKEIDNSSDEGFGFFFSSTGTSDQYTFEIRSTGYYYLSEESGKGWQKTTSTKTVNNYNILKVSKKGEYLYYYINGRNITKTKYNNSKGEDFGFIIEPSTIIEIDYFKIYGIKPPINLVTNPILNKIENLGKNVNSEFQELTPIISSDGNTLYFVRNDDPSNIGKDKSKNDIWVSNISGNNFSKAKNIGRPINNSGHNILVGVTADNNSVLLSGTYTAFGESITDGISISSKLKDGSWSIPRELQIDNFSHSSDHISYTVSVDLQIIIMSIKNKNSYGHNDLYVSFRKPNGTYTEPKNLGNTINTNKEEGTPFLAADGKTLYFFSKGHPGYGSADIFVSRRLDETWTNWSIPLNLGSNINSEMWDAYFSIDAKGEYAYFVSSNNAIGEEDIFRVKLQEELQPDPVVLIYGKVYDSKTKKTLRSQIIYENISTNKQVGIASSNAATGEYQIVLPYGKTYGFFAKKSGYMALSDNIELTDIQEYTEIKRDLYLTPIELNEQITLNNVFFEKGKATLTSSSYSELDRIVSLMKKNPEIKIEIQGHTNNIGERQKLIDLSKQRAESVKNYITSKGIPQNRISTLGNGPDKPIATNETPEGRNKNQRVEFKIIEK